MDIISLTAEQIVVFLIIGIWELIWKGVALWSCGRKNKLYWFIAMLLLSTAGILPIVYLLFFDKEKKAVSIKKKKNVSRK